ncbi:MAG: N-formylglutamate amidohydrolase [Sphingopyxis sp.]
MGTGENAGDNAETGAPAPPPYRIAGPQPPVRPVIITVPHAGRYYPQALLQSARVPRAVLERLEDRYADELAQCALAAGFTVVIAQYARALIDLNRGEDEWDSALVSGAAPPRSTNARVRSGLGIVPRRLHPVGDLWRDRLTHAELAARIHNVHRPYHGAIAGLIDSAAVRWGAAVLMDLHSMPTQAGGRPQMVVGDRYGATASAILSERLLAQGEGAGLHMARNAPYAGAHGIMRHADPAGRRGAVVDAVQIECDRALYLAADGAGGPMMPGAAMPGAAMPGAPMPDAGRTRELARLILQMAQVAEEHVLATGHGRAMGVESAPPIAAE